MTKTFPTYQELKSAWNKTYRGETLDVSKKTVSLYEARFNPVRANYMKTTQHANIDTDVFCSKLDKILANEKIATLSLGNLAWLLTINTAPIETYHSLLICSTHFEQQLSQKSLNDLHAISLLYPDLSIGFNGWGAGASQKHLHAQVVFSGFPIAKWEKDPVLHTIKNYPGICFYFYSPDHCLETIEQLERAHIPYNVLLTNGCIYLAPRKNEFDQNNTKRGFDSVFGNIPLLRQEDYDLATEEQISEIIAYLLYQTMEINYTPA
ncbi:hypothetical protein KA082_00985 [Candidatus Woesebacteria bacterium]|nr:hypothetical protein [Candidatus Woesebacteria bacterium]